MKRVRRVIGLLAAVGLMSAVLAAPAFGGSYPIDKRLDASSPYFMDELTFEWPAGKGTDVAIEELALIYSNSKGTVSLNVQSIDAISGKMRFEITAVQDEGKPSVEIAWEEFESLTVTTVDDKGQPLQVVYDPNAMLDAKLVVAAAYPVMLVATIDGETSEIVLPVNLTLMGYDEVIHMSKAGVPSFFDVWIEIGED